MDQDLKENLKNLGQHLTELFETLHLKESVDIASWANVLQAKLLPRLSLEFPLMAAICGGGSSGKSTLFNSITGDRVSPSGGSAGINRRILVSAPGELFRQPAFVTSLFRPLGKDFKPLENKTELTTPGCPLYVLNSTVPRNMVLMDTPDFDTGYKGAYTNREMVRLALEASDILIYIFTNANYNNRDSTDFISRMFTGIGIRKCFLVYRADAGVSQEDAEKHAVTVAKNIYGDDYPSHILGMYRTDEDNEVASGQRFMELYPIRPGDPAFFDAVKSLDPRTLRPELVVSILKDLLSGAEDYIFAASISRAHLQLYLNSLLSAQSLSVQDALKHFPMDVVIRRFAHIWMETDPGFIRMMRATGKVVGFPFKLITGAASWINRQVKKQPKDDPAETVHNRQMEPDLIQAATRLYQLALSTEISTTVSDQEPVCQDMAEAVERIRRVAPGQLQSIPSVNERIPRMETMDDASAHMFWVNAHPAVFAAQDSLRSKPWNVALKSILSQQHLITTSSASIDEDLKSLASDFRQNMNFSARVRHTLSAFLNVIPATVAVTYILSTGDLAGGTGIKVKLAGLFGLNDLYALVAIPATSGISNADQKQIETMLVPIAQTWLNNKLKTVQSLFEQEITGDLIRTARRAERKSGNRIRMVEHTLTKCRKAIASL